MPDPALKPPEPSNLATILTALAMGLAWLIREMVGTWRRQNPKDSNPTLAAVSKDLAQLERKVERMGTALAQVQQDLAYLRGQHSNNKG